MRIVGFASIAHHIRSMGKDIERRLKAFVANLQAPLGQIPFERAVMRHLPFLLDLRRRGLTWTSIVGIFRARAMRRADGRLISDDQLRGVVSWQDRRSKTKIDAAGRRSHS
jgi:hypothetical protein